MLYSEGMDCEVLDTIQSPEINGYRTKCEFTVGRNLKGEPTVGFLLGLYRDGITAVLSPEECLHVPEKAKKIAKAMEVYDVHLLVSKYQNTELAYRITYDNRTTTFMIA